MKYYHAYDLCLDLNIELFLKFCHKWNKSNLYRYYWYGTYTRNEEYHHLIWVFYCCLKSSIKILAFSKKLVTNLSSASKEGIIVTFLALTDDLSIVQYVFDEVGRGFNLLEKKEEYFSYEYLKTSTRVLLIDFRLL